MTKDELKARYGKSARGNFYIEDTISTPHPFTITDKHVAFAADHCCGILGEDAVEKAEAHGIHCGARGCQLTMREHGKGLVVSCKSELKNAKGEIHKELHAYLLSCADKAEQDKFEGFAFVKIGAISN